MARATTPSDAVARHARTRAILRGLGVLLGGGVPAPARSRTRPTKRRRAVESARPLAPPAFPTLDVEALRQPQDATTGVSRIFGALSDVPEGEPPPGTPTYMSPEQMAALGVRDPLAIDRESAPPHTLTADTAVTREQRRSRRKRAVRATTISMKRLTKRERELGLLLYPDDGHQLPRTRAECQGAERPCPFVSCKHHLYLDVSPTTGAIKQNFPDLEPWEMNESCALDVADRDGTTLEDVGAIMNVTRERIRQIEVRGLAKVEEQIQRSAMRDYAYKGHAGKRRLPVLRDDERLGVEEDDDEDDEDADGRP